MVRLFAIVRYKKCDEMLNDEWFGRLVHTHQSSFPKSNGANHFRMVSTSIKLRHCDRKFNEISIKLYWLAIATPAWQSSPFKGQIKHDANIRTDFPLGIRNVSSFDSLIFIVLVFLSTWHSIYTILWLFVKRISVQ